MPKTLEEWQKRLEEHFGRLMAERSASGFPLFALEHGLAKEEFEELSELLKFRLAANPWVPPHWLVWVVYAAELGYEYQGDEYWPSFEQSTPQWREKGSRDQLRRWFARFHGTFDGVEPSGQWAGWFRNIAWPITHAILPRYLQSQFAKTLYDLRYQLAHLETLTAKDAGQLLAANAFEATSRFSEFLQQEELAGRIALALLSDKGIEGQSPIFPPTLQRLVADLEKVQNAREWLKATRSLVTERIKGVSLGQSDRTIHGNASPSASHQYARDRPSVRPTLTLRRSTSTSWAVGIEIPSFAGVARMSPQFREFLKTTRCQVTGTGPTWLPAGWVLSSSQKRVLKSWPTPGAPLLRFEKSNALVDNLIQGDIRQSMGPVWIFKIGADGLAHEIVGGVVRPGQKYVVLSLSPLPLGQSMLEACNLACEGINAGVLSMPDPISTYSLNWLENFGLQVARTIRVWPSGLPARGWDGEGNCEWLTTETPLFAITHDHPVSGYSLSLNDGQLFQIKAGETGSPMYIQLQQLPVGQHRLTIKANHGYRVASALPSPAAEGTVILEVREPEPWIPGTTSYTGLAISVDPPEPNLDAFLEGRVRVIIRGPIGYDVKCSIAALAANGEVVRSDQILALPLPVSEEIWQRKLSEFLADENRAWEYQQARVCRLQIRGDELGEYALRLERDIKPLRWVCRSSRGITTLQLRDDTGVETAIDWRFYSFTQPAKAAAFHQINVPSDFAVDPPGGLFEAIKGEFSDAIVVSTQKMTGGLRGLLVEPDPGSFDTGINQVIEAISLLKLWTDSRAVGSLVALRRDRIVHRLLNRLYLSLCGRKWAEAEELYLSDRTSAVAISRLVSSVGWTSEFAKTIESEYARTETDADGGVQWFIETAARYRVCNNDKLSRFAMQLASRPQAVLELDRIELEGSLRVVQKLTSLLRGTRLLALLVSARHSGSGEGTLPRWEWS
jgi:hypothetical protein